MLFLCPVIFHPDAHSVAEIHAENLILKNLMHFFLKTGHAKLDDLRLHSQHGLQAPLAERKVDETACVTLLRIRKNNLTGVAKKSAFLNTG